MASFEEATQLIPSGYALITEIHPDGRLRAHLQGPGCPWNEYDFSADGDTLSGAIEEVCRLATMTGLKPDSI